MVSPLEALPPELYTDILSQIPLEYLQETTYSLVRAVPRSPVPQYHLFHYVRLKRSHQIFKLYSHLRKSPDHVSLIRYFALESWEVSDAWVVNNLIALLRNVSGLRLFIGPNYSPEHLEEMFEKPIEELESISLRFRPYVQKATYYHFLKGAYFDSTLEAFSRWPVARLHALSIIQDPLDPLKAPTHFAQPLVFFRLDPLSTLVCSPLLENLLHFRLRIPARQPTRFLYTTPKALPSVETLDLSTCGVSLADVEGVLARFTRLRTLVLDQCHIVIPRADVQHDDGLWYWAILGKAMAAASHKAAKDREKTLRTWLEAHNAHLAGNAPAPEPAQVRQRRPRRGRRGLATATISLRNSPPRDPVPIPAIPPGQLPPGATVGQIPRIRVLPSKPSVVSFTATAPVLFGPDKHEAIRAEFERGWAEGIALLHAVFRRIKASWDNGMRVMKFDDDVVDSEVGFAGLVDVDDAEDFELETIELDERAPSQCPVLCLAGPRRNKHHVLGCGHEVVWDVWGDEL
ncbi:hypothetical protein POSPLADRAFT_1051073 [Postia placenta MAD-698-R-SB12]|uniref:F-box domain-containing protein n=1 Tax=Postia placenta MAD-698-R-SB12 TaxID=670580 RepID=A0A1X6NE56_9APHY|nr:hypothetical protein POSPLADRAFT_1051073 [Postia placenta MAD-698-R-SB12]OSX66908.1 hypothetical protein POSPLADRAFT_1051073 [Postia placenta MAD-698-R-SB12]